MRRAIATVATSLLLLAGGSLDARAGHNYDFAFQFRLGGFFPDGESAFWDDTEESFTLDVSDFDDAILGLSFVGSFNNHVEAGLNIDFYEGESFSAVRGFVDEDGFPIFHDSWLRTVPLTIDVRFLPFGRYRQRPQGRNVLQPVFYLGGGVGLTYWEYEEEGDFVDFTNDEIFFDRFIDDGFAFETHALAGLELPFGRTWSLLLEGRYSWADDDLGGDFAGLGEIDLSGPSAYIGGSFHF